MDAAHKERIPNKLGTRNTILSAQTMMFAILPKLSVPTLSRPHSGFTPTGAELGSAEMIVRSKSELLATCAEMTELRH